MIGRLITDWGVAPTFHDETDLDQGNLSEVIAYPPHGIPSLHRDGDPCDEVLPSKQRDRKA